MFSKHRGRTFENLESRTMLAGNVTAAVVEGELQLTGDVRRNEIVISQTAEGMFEIRGLGTKINGSTQTFVAVDVTDGIDIHLGAAHDSALIIGTDAVEVTAHTRVGHDTIVNLTGVDDATDALRQRVARLVERVDQLYDRVHDAGQELAEQTVGRAQALVDRAQSLIDRAVDRAFAELDDLPSLGDVVDTVGDKLDSLTDAVESRVDDLLERLGDLDDVAAGASAAASLTACVDVAASAGPIDAYVSADADVNGAAKAHAGTGGGGLAAQLAGSLGLSAGLSI